MNIVETENKLKQVDSLLTTLTKVIKKHWLILLLLSISFIIYLNYDNIEQQQNDNIEQTDELNNDDDSIQVEEE